MSEVSLRVHDLVVPSLGRDLSPDAFFTLAVIGGALDLTDCSLPLGLLVPSRFEVLLFVTGVGR